MFNVFSWQHIFILLVVALVVVGPKDLPRLVRMAGIWARQGKSVADGLRRNLDDLANTADLDWLRAEMNALKKRIPSELEVATPPAARPSRG